MPNPINCEYVGMVDFGEGPVKVRCTEIGEHTEHKVEVILGTPGREGYEYRNVFDDEDDDVRGN